MTPFVRNEIIEMADDLVNLSKTLFDLKKIEVLRRAAKLYKESTLSIMAEIIEKEANYWSIWLEDK